MDFNDSDNFLISYQIKLFIYKIFCNLYATPNIAHVIKVATRFGEQGEGV